MEFLLVVVRGFGAHVTGDLIDAADAVRDVLDGPHAAHVVRVAKPVAPAPISTQED